MSSVRKKSILRTYERVLGRLFRIATRKNSLEFLKSAQEIGVLGFEVNYLGQYPFLLDAKAGSITQAVLESGHFSMDLMEQAKTLGLLKSGRFVNVGANIGTTIYNAYHLGYRDLVGYEPVTSNFAYLNQNVGRLGDNASLDIFKCACGAKQERIEISKHPHSSGKHSFVKSHGSETELVNVVRLDDAMQSSKPIGVIWVDVEGFEYQVIAGARHIIGLHHPTLCLEIIPDLLNDQVIATFTELLVELGYRPILPNGRSFETLRAMIENSNGSQFDVFCTFHG